MLFSGSFLIFVFLEFVKMTEKENAEAQVETSKTKHRRGSEPQNLEPQWRSMIKGGWKMDVGGGTKREWAELVLLEGHEAESCGS